MTLGIKVMSLWENYQLFKSETFTVYKKQMKKKMLMKSLSANTKLIIVIVVQSGPQQSGYDPYFYSTLLRHVASNWENNAALLDI